MVSRQIETLRNRPDMCGAFAVESVASSLLKNSQFKAPLWVWDYRLKFLELTRLIGQLNKPDDKVEFAWVKLTLEKLRKEFRLPFEEVGLNEFSDVGDLITISQSSEIIFFGRTVDYRRPHMYHLGRLINDNSGKRFESLQQTTYLVDLADFFLRMNKSNAVVIR